MKHNSFSFKELKTILNIKTFYHLDELEVYDTFVITKAYCDILDEDHTLYFPITILEEDDGGGWYPKSSDTRQNINYYIKEHPGYTYVIDEETYDLVEDKSAKVIIVDSIMNSINQLYHYIMEHRQVKSILVTGSVGKTSAVGLIEAAIKDHVLRIYAKRITPVILKNFIINYLTNDISYMVLEAGLFHKHHVAYFSQELKPYISVLLNILPEHMGIDSIHSVKDIVEGKMEIFRYATYALVNYQDEELKKLAFHDGKCEYEKHQIDTKVEKVFDISNLHDGICLYVHTNLSKIQYQSAFVVASILGIPDDIIMERLNTSTPVENRVCKQKIFGHDIIFDGDVSGVARFRLFTDHFYPKAVLVLRHLTTGGEEEEDYSQFPLYFERFSHVYIFKDIPQAKVFSYDNVIWVDNHDFIKELDSDVAIFYHYGSYYRKYKEFRLEYLEEEII